MRRISTFCFIWLAGILTFTSICNAHGANSWNNFISPTVNLVNEATDHPGAQLFLDLIEEAGYESIEEWVQSCCQVINKELYATVDEANAIGLTKITYIFTDGGALSSKDGAAPHITVSFDLNYLVSFYEKHGANAARDELYGVLCHELMHGYQREPVGAGVYQKGDEFFGFIEGTADLGRMLTGGFNPQRFPSAGNHWNDGYCNTAFFYKWILETRDPEFLVRLNATCKTQKPWSLDKALEELFGEEVSAQMMWSQFENEIPQFNSEANAWVND